MKLIYLQPHLIDLLSPGHAHTFIPAPANISDAELVLAMFPNEAMQRCFVAYECVGKLISSGERH